MRPLLLALLPALAIAQSSVKSPDGAIELSFSTDNGQLAYAVSFHGKPLVARSTMALEIQDQPGLGAAMRIVDAKAGAVDETYSMPHGKSNPVRNVCRTLTLNLEETRGPNRKLTVEARAYDDGVAFRYLVPNQPIITELRLAGERTEFQLAKDASTFPLILENFRTSYEDNYRNLPLTAIHPAELVALPLLAEVAGVGWVAITEANIDNYAGMYLQRNGREARSLFPNWRLRPKTPASP